MKTQIRLAALGLVTTILAACGGGGGGNDADSAGPQPAATVDLTGASDINAGEPVQLSWTTSSATACSASGGWSGARATSGSESVGPINAASTFTLTCNGVSDSIVIAPFAAQSDKTSAEPLEQLTLTLTSVGSAPAGELPRILIDIDASGLDTFLPGNTITLEGLIEGTRVKVAAPLVELFQGTVTAETTFAVRARRQSGQIELRSSPIVVRYIPIAIPAELRGASSTALQLILKTMLETSASARTYAERIRPGSYADARTTLGVTSPLADIYAEAILRQAFGTTALPRSGATSSKLQRGPQEKFGQPILDAYERMIACPLRQFASAIETWEEAAGVDCLNQARIEIRDNVIPNLGAIPEQTGSVFSSLSKLLRGSRLGSLLASRAVQAELSAEMADAAVATGQVILTLPFETPEQSAHYFAGELTRRGAEKLYENMVEDLPDLAQQALEMLGAPDLVTSIVTGAQREVFYDIENSLVFQSELDTQLSSNPEMFGGTTDAPATSDPPDEIPVMGGDVISVGEGATPASICAQYPALDSGFQSLGLTCEQYLTPFFDPEFMRTTIRPLLDAVPIDQMLADCADPLSARCEALTDQILAQMEQLFDAIRGYAEEDFHCDGGYTEYEASAENTRTCLFSALAYTPPAGTCFAGSRRSPFDVGGRSVCVYYSRDYVRGGSCVANYTRVFFFGTDRCRWSTLPVSKPAAYTVNSLTGAETILEQ